MSHSEQEFKFYPREPLPSHRSRKHSTVAMIQTEAAYETSVDSDILILSHDLSESGAPRAAYDIARTLSAGGHFVVVASPIDGPYRERLRAVGVNVIIDQRLFCS